MSVADSLRRYCNEMLVLPSPAIAEFVRRLLDLALDCGCVSGELPSESVVQFVVGADRVEFASSDARTLLRLLCARFAGLASEQGCTASNPYDCEYDMAIRTSGAHKNWLRIHVQNKLEHPQFRLTLVQGPRHVSTP
jgi:hypothetical protein